MTDGQLSEWQGLPVARLAEQWGVPLLEVHRSLPSTNDRARLLAEQGAPPFTSVLADEQTSGRGRGAKRWHSPSGCGLWLSVVLPGRSDPGGLPVSLLAGLAAAEAIELQVPALAVGIEWPNDLTLGRGKVGGILCESSGDSVVAGIGINLRTPADGYPADLVARATSLAAEQAMSVSSSALGASLLARLKHRLGTSPGPGDALEALRSRDALLDRQLETDQQGRGRARGIAADGALLLERADGTRVAVVAGSVRPVESVRTQ